MLTKRRIPNALTFLRIAAVPLVLFIALRAPEQKAALFWIFLLAAATDFLDGYLARKWNATSPFGAMLDQIGDKLLVATLLLYLVVVHNPCAIAMDRFGHVAPRGIIHFDSLFLPAIVIILRELYVSGLREFLALRRIALPVSRLGKYKTAGQMLGIGLLLCSDMLFQQAAGSIGLAVPAWLQLIDRPCLGGGPAGAGLRRSIFQGIGFAGLNFPAPGIFSRNRHAIPIGAG